MSYENAELLRDKNGNPIPQYFNISTGKFEPVTGENGGTSTQVIGSNVEEVEVFESVAISDVNVDSETIDISNFKRYYFKITNSLDKEVRMWARNRLGRPFYSVWDGEKWTEDALIIKPYDKTRIQIYESNFHDFYFSNLVSETIAFRLFAPHIPESGSISVTLVGVK